MVRGGLDRHQPNKGRHLAVAMRGYVAFPGLTDQRIVTPRGPGGRPTPGRSRSAMGGECGLRRGERGASRSAAHTCSTGWPTCCPRSISPTCHPVARPTTCRCLRHNRDTVAGGGCCWSATPPVADQPVHRRGHLLRGAVRLARRARGGRRTRCRRPGPTPGRWRRRLGRHLRHSRRGGRPARRPTVIQAAVRAAGNDRPGLRLDRRASAWVTAC